eukprot:CAMPEP_0198331422 /NCGR_PEP_ID=MMETSP1450-20131203/17578_1 /TAXON_ID=753684 ORGANISM="Madagascaria erythrocladiodes, Strain CCMP3234" /NCGR_SAMPLE_ID=MMETSP1450 /ASSEMBLY_ACC=CAM_ASM_001115 /LENGTH=91 /DNA_ID=CAMNT_0044035789 /DNA_START=69 /DNA_END=344 /DNA_ORIENTATION=-
MDLSAPGCLTNGRTEEATKKSKSGSARMDFPNFDTKWKMELLLAYLLDSEKNRDATDSRSSSASSTTTGALARVYYESLVSNSCAAALAAG